MIMTGNVPPVRVPTPPKHVPLYYDPLNVPLAMVKEHHKEVVREKEEKIKAKEYQQKLDTIPIVPYHPGTKLKQIKEVTRNKKGKKSVEKEYDLFSFEHKAEVVHDSDTPLGDYTNKFDSAESPYTAEIRKSRSAKSSSFGRSGLNSPGFQSYLENISKSMMEEGLLPIDSQQINGLYNADDFGENQDATRKDSPTESFVELDDYDSINSPPLEAHPPISKHYSTGQLLVQSTIDSGTTQKPKSQPGRIESTSEEKIVEEADNYHADGANQDYYGQDLEEGLMAAMEAARNGDKEALYNFHIRMVKQGSANPFGMDWN